MLDFSLRSLSSEGDDHGIGVHVEALAKFQAVVFIFVVYVAGKFSKRVLQTPSLVGEIIAGIILGPELLDFVPNVEAFVLFGEIGLFLLVLEAGVDIDLTTLKLIGTRGIIIAIVGSILPIIIGILIAFAFGITETKSLLAAGAAFGPTSLGITMNILREGKIANTPVGQLIISAAVIDDMIAIVMLSMLKVLEEGVFTFQAVGLPIIYSILILVVGGCLAVFVLPYAFHDYVLRWFPEEFHTKLSIGTMFLWMIALMALCDFLEAGQLLGIFIAGLSFCRDNEVHHEFEVQFKRLLQWLMRIFFATVIGFQVPIKLFGKTDVILKGLVFLLALTGKLAVGLLVPNFSHSKKFTGNHMRDVLITGLAMAAEGEFAFVIASFAQQAKLIDMDIYASIVLAVLISTIIPPFMLRFIINRYNKKAEALLQSTFKKEMTNSIIKMDSLEISEEALKKSILEQTAIFACIQMHCQSRWGLLPNIMAEMKKNSLEVIDHRSWHARGMDSTLVNEIYVKGSCQGEYESYLDGIKETLFNLLGQADAKIKVTRWYPGIETEIVEEIGDDIEDASASAYKSTRRLSVSGQVMSVSGQILQEAQALLEKNQNKQQGATKERTVDEILHAAIPVASIDINDQAKKPTTRQRPRRVRTMSTPVVGGDMFAGRSKPVGATSFSRPSPSLALPSFNELSPSPSIGKKLNAQLTISDETFQIQVSSSTLTKVRKGREMHLQPKDIGTRGSIGSNEPFNLDGLVRKTVAPSNLPPVSEEEELE